MPSKYNVQMAATVLFVGFAAIGFTCSEAGPHGRF